MRITESNVTQWGLRPADAPGPAREARTATIASQVDKNPRDGWIDEYDLPYDQLELLEQARAKAAAQAAHAQAPEAVREAPEAPAPAPPQPPAARVDVTARDSAAPAPQVDLLA